MIASTFVMMMFLMPSDSFRFLFHSWLSHNRQSAVFPQNKCFVPGPKWRQHLLFYDAPTLSPAASLRKFNLFIGSFRKCYGGGKLNTKTANLGATIWIGDTIFPTSSDVLTRENATLSSSCPRRIPSLCEPAKRCR